MGMNSTANTIKKLHQSISIRNKSVNMRIIYADYAHGMRACDFFWFFFFLLINCNIFPKFWQLGDVLLPLFEWKNIRRIIFVEEFCILYFTKCCYAKIIKFQVFVLFLVLLILWFFQSPKFMLGWGDLFRYEKNINILLLLHLMLMQ